MQRRSEGTFSFSKESRQFEEEIKKKIRKAAM